MKKKLINTLAVTKLLGKNKYMYFTGVLLSSSANALSSVLLAFVFKNIIDGITYSDISLYYKSIIYLMLIMIALCVINPFARYLYSIALEKALAELRMSLYSKLKRGKVQYFENQHSGIIISKVINDVDAIRKSFKNEFTKLTGAVLTGVIAIAAMFSQNILIAVGFIAFGVASGFLISKYSIPIRKKSHEIQETKEVNTKNMLEAISGIRTTKMYNLEDTMVEQLYENNNEIKNLTIKRGKYFARLYSLNTALRWINRTGVLVIGSYLAINGVITPGTLVAFAGLQTSASYMFVASGTFIAKLQTAYVSYIRIKEILYIPVELPKDHIVDDSTGTDEIIDFKNVKFSYDSGNNVLDGISISFMENEFHRISGESGRGKSTLFKLLLGFYENYDGIIKVYGKNINEYSLTELRNFFSYVPQNAHMFSGTIKENLQYGNSYASEKDMHEALKNSGLYNFIKTLPEGINTKIGEGGSLLSGGQRQRLAIARAFLRNAPILLFDESTSALDSTTENLIMEFIGNKLVNKTVLFISHKNSEYQLESSSRKMNNIII